MTVTEALNDNLPSSARYDPSDAETVQQCRRQPQQQQQQRESEPAAYDEKRDECYEENRGDFQNERGTPDDLKRSHQYQTIYDTPQNGKQARGEMEVRHGREHAVNKLPAPLKEKYPQHMYGEEDDAEQEVTDPVTHSSVTKHDFTNQELKQTLRNMPLTGNQQLPVSGAEENPKNKTQLDKTREGKEPNDNSAMTELIRTFRFATNVGMGVVLLIMTLVLLFGQLVDVSKSLWSPNEVDRRPWTGAMLATIILEVAVFGFGVLGIRCWVENKVYNFWEDQDWKTERLCEAERADAHTSESAQWLNSLLASVWPLVNPDLFTGLADTLEDSMQANLPTLVNMIGVEDIGQGSEAPRILGIRWLPPGTTADSTSANRKKVHGDDNGQEDTEREDRNSQQQDQKPGQDDKYKPRKERDDNLMEALKSEEGNSVCLEVTFAYRARSNARNLGTEAKSAHIFLAIYLPASIRLPIWVELQGFVGVVRLRLQFTPDPPVLALCTFTFAGQPKAKLSCIPLFKHGLNVMNLPVISNFVQTSFDASMANYVAPKSSTLDLRDVLMTADFKKDTNAHGVVVVHIMRAIGFKENDARRFRMSKESADPYVSVSWIKFRKSVWSTRVIASETEPIWDETGFVIVGPNEFNTEEKLRVQLWDTNQYTASSDLGSIDIGLKEVMQNPATNGRILRRRDNLHTLSADDEDTPRTLEWSLGYFPKTNVLPTQLAQHTEDQDVRSVDDFKKKATKKAAEKLREGRNDQSCEIEKQKMQDLKTREDEIIISSPPSPDYPSGVLAIQIHQILGLGIKNTTRNREEDDYGDDEQVEGGDLLSTYCTVILNNRKVLRTRTKPRNAKPSVFMIPFNVGIERFVRDWQTAEVILSVRDLRMREHDPVVGVVVFPLAEVFRERSQVNDYFPLSGGIGHGRVRISMVFRSIQLQAPIELLGWECGTLQITPEIKSNDLPEHYMKFGLKLRTSVESDGISAQLDGWSGHQGQPVELAVRQRYRSNLLVEFQENGLIHRHISVFAILWLKEIPDGVEKTVTLPVWRGNLKRAEANCELENGEKLGHIEVRLIFRPGTSDHHRKLASKDRNLADVMEILRIASDSKTRASREEAVFESHNNNISGHEDRHENDWPQQASKEHGDRLHQTAHKITQWKGAHTTRWAKHKVETAGSHISDHLQRHDHEQDPDIEPDS